MMGLKLLPKQKPTPRDLPKARSLSLEPEDGGRRTDDGGGKPEQGSRKPGFSGLQPSPQEVMDLMKLLLEELRKGKALENRVEKTEEELRKGKALENRVEKTEEELCRLMEAGDEMSRVLLRHAHAAVVVYNKLEALRRLTGCELPPPLPSSPFSVATEPDELIKELCKDPVDES